MPEVNYGRHHQHTAAEKSSSKVMTNAYTNNLTRRNALLVPALPARTPSTSLMSANIKSLRLFRHVCRMIPFILKVHELNHRVTPVQSKRYVANWFREHAHEKDLARIDYLIDYGYETIFEAENHHSNTGYLYRFFAPPTHKYRDFGVDRFVEKKGDRINQLPNSSFLNGFYKGHKNHVV